MKLRSYLYINQRLVDDYLSAIDGSLYEEEIVKSKQGTIQNTDIEDGLPRTGTSGSLSFDERLLSEKKLKITYAAKIKRIVDYLKENDELQEIEELDKDSLDKLKRDDFIEVFVDVRSSKMQQLVEGLNKMVEMFSSLGSLVNFSESDQTMINQMQDLSNMKETIDGGVCQLVFNPDGQTEISLIAQLEKGYLLDSIEKINKQCYVLCKVQRKIKEGEEIEVDSLLAGMDGIKPFMDNEEELTNPPEIKDVITAPGAFVLPVAIYQ
jgi:hypothetical protein